MVILTIAFQIIIYETWILSADEISIFDLFFLNFLYNFSQVYYFLIYLCQNYSFVIFIYQNLDYDKFLFKK
jgi:hypothetical protein